MSNFVPSQSARDAEYAYQLAASSATTSAIAAAQSHSVASSASSSHHPQPQQQYIAAASDNDSQHESYWQPDKENEEMKDEGEGEGEGEEIVSYAEEADVEEDDEEIEVDDTEPPRVGDLTAAFFNEMSAARESNASKKRKGGGEEDDNSSVDSDKEFGLSQHRAFRGRVPSHLRARLDLEEKHLLRAAQNYLRQVEQEAAALPFEKTADNIDPRAYEYKQTPYMPSLSKLHTPTNSLCIPSSAWSTQFAYDFSEARSNLVCFAANNNELRKGRMYGVPQKLDYDEWMKYCLGADSAAEPSSTSTSSASSSCTPHPPSLALLISLEQIECRGILSMMLEQGVEAIESWRKNVEGKQNESEMKEESTSPMAAAASSSTTSTSSALASSSPAFPSSISTLWIYSLLLRLDKPLNDSISGDLRNCYRSLSWLRAKVNDEKEDLVKWSNMIMELCRQFGQAVLG